MYKIITIGCYVMLMASSYDIIAKTKKSKKSQVEQQAPEFFQAENGVTGQYWCKLHNRPAHALIKDQQFINIVVIKVKSLQSKRSKKLRKGKEYLGMYISPTTGIEYNLYGVNKNPEPQDDGPDADVLTVIAIKQGYGIGE